ncbi:SH3 domain-containing protein [Bacillus massilinigeriensis]|uniref:SH3 domain-containing protein n=1 Tax=Bacillus massilionigeriensis TaxID=1805475 RepID=UPI00096AF2B7|nr:SH3 domain-containing protein [Bacillus massilionigeriensis]
MNRKLFYTKIVLVIALILSVFTPILSNEAEAASKKYSASVISSSVKVKDKASSKAKTVGTLKKGTKVTVYAKTKSGWSEIRYKSKKAYVPTKSLKFASSQSSSTGSYLRNTKYLYTYQMYFSYPSNYIDYTTKFTKKDKDGYNVWSDTNKWVTVEREKETKSGLYLDGRKFLSYPLKEGKTWKSGDMTFTIKKIGTTVETGAGKFKNVVRVDTKYDSLSTILSYYFAKGYGLVYVGDLQTPLTMKDLKKIKK